MTEKKYTILSVENPKPIAGFHEEGYDILVHLQGLNEPVVFRAYSGEDMMDWEFMAEIAQRAHCLLLAKQTAGIQVSVEEILNIDETCLA